MTRGINYLSSGVNGLIPDDRKAEIMKAFDELSRLTDELDPDVQLAIDTQIMDVAGSLSVAKIHPIIGEVCDLLLAEQTKLNPESQGYGMLAAIITNLKRLASPKKDDASFSIELVQKYTNKLNELDQYSFANFGYHCAADHDFKSFMQGWLGRLSIHWHSHDKKLSPLSTPGNKQQVASQGYFDESMLATLNGILESNGQPPVTNEVLTGLLLLYIEAETIRQEILDFNKHTES